MKSARDRFIAKCEFMPASGCVLWRGGTTSSRNHTERTGVFWYKGKTWLARRWAAEHIHGIDLMGKETSTKCGDPLCVQHVSAEVPMYAHRQFYVLEDLGYCSLEPRTPPVHDGSPFHECPAWMKGEDK